MGSLPADRLSLTKPFAVFGVDLCGPFLTSYRIRGKAPYKTYIAVFVCFATKAVHIELVSDLSTNTFILCLKRFITFANKLQLQRKRPHFEVSGIGDVTAKLQFSVSTTIRSRLSADEWSFKFAITKTIASTRHSNRNINVVNP